MTQGGLEMVSRSARGRRWVGLVTVLIVLAGIGTAASGAEPPQLRIGIHTEEGWMTPYSYVTGYPGLPFVRMIYDTLFIMNAERTPVPWMVREYSTSEDGLTWTLKLHEGIEFHDGTPLTSADVAFSYTFMTLHGHGPWQRSLRGIKSVEATDEHTVVIQLERVLPLFKQVPLAEVVIIPRHVWEGVTDPKTITDATGSGPYRLVEYQSGQFYRLEAHPNYFHAEQKPSVASIIVPFIPDATTMFMALKAGEIDMGTRDVPPEMVADLAGTAGLKVERGPSYVSTLLAINNQRPPFNQVDFRRALELVVDVQYLVDIIRLGQATIGSPGFVHPMSPWVAAVPEAVKQDFAAAARLLDGLGFTDRNGDGLREDPQGNRFQQTIITSAERPERVRVAQIIGDWFKQAGLDTVVQAMEHTTVQARVWPDFDVTKGRDYDLAVWGWSAGVQENPLNLWEVLHTRGTLNVGAFSDPAVDAIAERLLGVTNRDDFRPVVEELARTTAGKVPFITLWYPDNSYAYRPEAHDGWVYVRGLGILDKLSLIGPVVAGGGPVGPVGARSLPWIVLAVVLAGAGIVVARRKRRS